MFKKIALPLICFSALSSFSMASYAEDENPMLATKPCVTGKIEYVSLDYKDMFVKIKNDRIYTASSQHMYNIMYDAFKMDKTVTVYTSTIGAIGGDCTKGSLNGIKVE